MSFLKKASFLVLMLALTLGAIEGMARLAYYVVHDETYEKQEQRLSNTMRETPRNRAIAKLIRHPYFGFSPSDPHNDLNVASPSHSRREGTIVIGLLGGSVANQARHMFKNMIHQYLQDNNFALEPVVLYLSWPGMKQPQQLMIVSYMLFLGQEFDIIVNLDGHNELDESISNFSSGFFPAFPYYWHLLANVTTDQLPLIARMKVLRDKQNDILANREGFWNWSAAFALIDRFRFERMENTIRILHHQLEEIDTKYNLETHGPRTVYRNEEEVRQAAAREWYRGSVLLAALAEDAGADYYHFLQPNQYLPDSKPFSEKELETAFFSDDPRNTHIREGYPVLIQYGRELKQQGIKFFDLTQIFKNNHETLYRDGCCHLNDRGNELLTEQMVQRMAGSFLKDNSPEFRPTTHQTRLGHVSSQEE